MPITIVMLGIFLCAGITIYAFYYCIRPQMGWSDSAKNRKARGDSRAMLWLYIGFPVVATILGAIIDKIYE